MKIQGKIVRAGKCPIDKKIPCDQCSHYDGWGIDIIAHRIFIWCYPKRMIDAGQMKMVIPIT